MALFSGAGPAGLAAPLPVKRFADNQVRLRPLLCLKRRKIEQLLRSIEAPWRDDETNSDTSYTRNWIRHQLVPNLLSGFPQDIYAGSSHSQTLMKEAVEALDELLNGYSIDFANPDQVDLQPLKNQPRALVRRAIMAWWMQHRPEHRLEAAILEGLLCGFSEGGRISFSIGGNELLVLDPNGALQIQPEHLTIPGDWPAGASWHWPAGPLFLPDGSWLSAEVFDWSTGPVPAYQNADPATEAWIARWPLFFHVRQWQAGDRYRPLGAPGRRKLQDLFTDAKIAAEQKRSLPVLVIEQEEILWVPGFPPNEAVRILPQGNSALKLTYHMQ